jgi:hypothetical protein
MDLQYEPYWSNYLSQFKDLPVSFFQNITNKTDKFCIIVEPRCHELLIPVIKNFMCLLKSKGYGLMIFHGTENEEFIKKGLEGWPNTIYYIPLNKSNLTIEMYNELFKSSSFWQTIQSYGCEHALIFQTDTVLLKDTVDDYLKYDYIGAPWRIKYYYPFGCHEIGNGGLSLRRVETMINIIRKKDDNEHNGNEDGYFGFRCLRYGYTLPSCSVASSFSVETIYYHDPCGMHKPHIGNFPSYDIYIELLSKKVNIRC